MVRDEARDGAGGERDLGVIFLVMARMKVMMTKVLHKAYVIIVVMTKAVKTDMLCRR